MKFLGLHFGKFSRVGGFESKRIETNIARVVIVVELGQPRLGLDVLVLLDSIDRVLPTNQGASDFGCGDTGGKPSEEEGRDIVHLRKVRVGGSTHGSTEEGVEFFRDQVSDGGKHGNASVGDFGFTESLNFLNGKVLGKPHGIKLAEGRKGTREASAEFGRIGRPPVDGWVRWGVHDGGSSVGHGER